MAFPVLDAVGEGYEASPVVDARPETVPGIVEIALTEGPLQE
jgi:hypothetical protein